ncbi:kinase-like domain-containing protein [Rhizophagus irregularis DAOM 181602=DAOM 197198]|nr:kinase-like domain-containing protein [Rhizophagus irregularis DAOM 181602=DAOM 197198]
MLTWNFLDSTATPWTDVNFDDQFLRTLGNTLFSFLGFGGTFQSEGLMILWMFFRKYLNESPDIGSITSNLDVIYKSRPLSAMTKSAKSTRNLKSQSISLKFDK